MFYFYLSDLFKSNGFIMIEMEAITRLQDYTLFSVPWISKIAYLYYIFILLYIFMYIYTYVYIYNNKYT